MVPKVSKRIGGHDRVFSTHSARNARFRLSRDPGRADARRTLGHRGRRSRQGRVGGRHPFGRGGRQSRCMPMSRCSRDRSSSMGAISAPPMSSCWTPMAISSRLLMSMSRVPATAMSRSTKPARSFHRCARPPANIRSRPVRSTEWFKVMNEQHTAKAGQSAGALKLGE